MKSKKIFALPMPKGALGRSATDLSNINTTGTIIGANDFAADGKSLSSRIRASSDVAAVSTDSIEYLDAYFTANHHPISVAGRETIRPKSMTRPRSAPIVPAAAIGPGVGGTRQWVA